MRQVLILAVAMFVASVAQAQNGRILTAEDFSNHAPFFKGRCAGMDTYKIASGRLEKVQEQEITPTGDECRITVKQNLQGTWEVVRSSRTFDMSGPGF
jgi:hypothetical protein